MTIIAPLPFALVNGQVADGSQVQANLDQIRNDVNAAFASDAPPAQGYLGCVVHQTTDATVASTGGGGVGSPFTTLTFTTTNDTSNIHSNSVNPTRLTVPVGVTRVRLYGQLSIEIGGPGFILLGVRKNNSNFSIARYGVNVVEIASSGSVGTQIQVMSTALVVTAGDYFELSVSQNGSGDAETFSPETLFEMQILG